MCREMFEWLRWHACYLCIKSASISSGAKPIDVSGSFSINSLFIRHSRYFRVTGRHGRDWPLCWERHFKYCVSSGLQSPSWSKGNDPFSGGILFSGVEFDIIGIVELNFFKNDTRNCPVWFM